MSNCLFAMPLGVYGLTGTALGVALGLALKYATRLSDPASPQADARIGNAILAGCMIAGCLVGVTVQAIITGSCD